MFVLVNLQIPLTSIWLTIIWNNLFLYILIVQFKVNQIYKSETMWVYKYGELLLWMFKWSQVFLNMVQMNIHYSNSYFHSYQIKPNYLVLHCVKEPHMRLSTILICDTIWHAELKIDFHSLNASVHSFCCKEELAPSHMDRIAPAATAYILSVYWAI